MEKLGIYRYHEIGRYHDIQGIFLATDEEVEKLIGTELYLGEIAGKHSEVTVEVTKNDIILVTEDALAVEIFSRYGLSNGVNPFDYIPEEEEADGDDDFDNDNIEDDDI